ncbi:MAG: glutamine--fructose-6-phosphate transaminase (isomerizing) [Clostridia bacterium]|nr:glutamine--fructose-6-phosphate transaminase (isomerizing) [Clostridia bacterium]
MCGIVGYIGDSLAAPILINGLKKLEYRGYDSAGIAVFNENNRIDVIKTQGRLSALEKLILREAPQGSVGIGHTRWATHGEPNHTNAHPHFNESKTIAVVHNGIIENHTELRESLTSHGYRFVSQTDTEVAAHLLDYYYKKEKNPKKAISMALARIEGSYAFGILFADCPNQVFAARKDSPLAVGTGENESFIASDAPAILKYTRDVVYIDNHEIAEIRKDSIKVYNLKLEEIEKKATHIEWNMEAAEKCGFEHFMLKDIHEQPTALRNTLSPRMIGGKITLSELGLSDDSIRKIRKIHIVACGSAYHAGVVGKYVIEKLARIPVEVDLASEFRYREPILEENSICIAISQSGETADTLAALREAKRQGVFTVAIVNVIGSTIAREADSVIDTHAGPEISVATTKAYSAQIATCYLVALRFAFVRGTISEDRLTEYVKQLKSVPAKITELLKHKESIRHYANRCAAERDIFFIGRGIDYAAALEGSLKLKEISYIHSDAYAAGELKHGTISLVEDGTLVVSLATQPNLYQKTVSNTAEVACRGARVFALTFADNAALIQNAEFSLILPDVDPIYAASLAVVPLQLFAYYVSLAKGLDVDKPRNLAKSVTVE